MTRLTASTTGVWAGTEPREAASASFEVLAEAWPAIPWTAAEAAGGTRWAVDAIGQAAGLLGELHADLTSYGWRLTAGSGDPRDARRVRSLRGQVLDAVSEYAAGWTGPTVLSLPGPWTLVTALSLPGGAPVLSDAGARRDVVQAYAHGVAEFTAEIARHTGGEGAAPHIRFVEHRLRPVLTGTWPTVSGFRTLPAVPEQQVYAALRSTARYLPAVIWSLPDPAPVRIGGKRIPLDRLLTDIGAEAFSLPVSRLDAAGFEQLALAHEAGRRWWVRLPEIAGDHPDQVNRWVTALRAGWQGIGMNVSGLREAGVLTREELPLDNPPLLPATSSPGRSRDHMRLARGVAAALQELT